MEPAQVAIHPYLPHPAYFCMYVSVVAAAVIAAAGILHQNMPLPVWPGK